MQFIGTPIWWHSPVWLFEIDVYGIVDLHGEVVRNVLCRKKRKMWCNQRIIIPWRLMSIKQKYNVSNNSDLFLTFVAQKLFFRLVCWDRKITQFVSEALGLLIHLERESGITWLFLSKAKPIQHVKNKTSSNWSIKKLMDLRLAAVWSPLQCFSTMC